MEHDLSKIAAELPATEKKHHGSGRWKPVLLAVVVPLGLVALLWLVFREQLVRAVPVETARVILLEQEGRMAVPASGKQELLFQASGWVEPAPWPVSLVVKTDGFIEEVFIKEGESVTNGQMVATLDPTDARLALEISEANVLKHEAMLNTQRNTAAAEAKQAEAAHFRVEAAVARLNRERDTSDRFAKSSPGVVSRAERVAAELAVIEFEAEEKAARAALTAFEAKSVAAVSEINVAEAALVSAEKKKAVAELALERTVIRSTMDGIILRRFVTPGDKRVLKSDDEHSAHIATIYNPSNLQVRVDVPISEAGKMAVGQPARISTAMIPGKTFDGRITRIIGQADLQRNTLQAKVEIKQPDARLRPDVLCRVEFMRLPASGNSGGVSSVGHSLWIPVRALKSDAREQEVWVVDPLTQTVQQREIQLSTSTRDGYREVAKGVRANEMIDRKSVV